MRNALAVLMVVVVALMPVALFMGSAVQQEEIDRARVRHHNSELRLRDLSLQLQRAEATLTRMTTSPRAVEDEVLAQMRMVRPGEKLILLQYAE